jgi:hypothetical protein
MPHVPLDLACAELAEVLAACPSLRPSELGPEEFLTALAGALYARGSAPLARRLLRLEPQAILALGRWVETAHALAGREPPPGDFLPDSREEGLSLLAPSHH